MGLEPTTFCMASRRSSQLSYIRERGQYSPAPGVPSSARQAAPPRLPIPVQMTLNAGEGEAAERFQSLLEDIPGIVVLPGPRPARTTRASRCRSTSVPRSRTFWATSTRRG